MKLDELKQQWQEEQHTLSTEQIQQRVGQRSSAISARMAKKALIESAAFVLVFIVFFTGLDPEKNTLWVNFLFAGAIGIGIANNLWLYRSLSLNRQGQNMYASLQSIVRHLWVQIQFSVIFSVLFFTSVTAFLMLRIPLSTEKIILILVLLGLSIMIRSGVEISRWKGSIRKINLCLQTLSNT